MKDIRLGTADPDSGTEVMAKTFRVSDDFPLDASMGLIVGPGALATINTTSGPIAAGAAGGVDVVLWADIHDWSNIPTKPALTGAQLTALGFTAMSYGDFYS